jgi:hypothetical protein
MNTTLSDICNNNPKNMPADDVYKVFNEFIFSSDHKLIGKLLHRFNFFNIVKDLPGDIVEIGVFKGSGIATFTKFINIFCPNSNKKVLGFDIFDSINKNDILDKDNILDKETMNVVYSKVDNNELSLESVDKRLSSIGSDKRHILIRGDVEETIPEFLKNNPGFRTSLIYIDVDLERATYYSLKYLWDRLLPGGIILFDEYEYHKFSESCGVEKFLKEKNMEFNLISTQWIAPTCYMVKKGF